MTSRQDVAVVGGSASGLLAATLLARRGLDVTVYERAPNLEPAPRTLIVTSRMRQYIAPLGETAVVNEIRRLEMFVGDRAATVALQSPDLVVERSALIRELWKESEAAGATIKLGHRLVALDEGFDGVDLHMKTGATRPVAKVRAGRVIGADGATSKVASAAGWPEQPRVPLLQALVRLPAGMPSDTTRIWFRPHETPYFYWLIPESETHGALGMIGVHPELIRADLERFLKELQLVPIEYQAARIPVSNRWVPVHKKLGPGDVYLVGDAAAQVKVTTVGGLVTGFRGTLGVVESIFDDGRSQELRALARELRLHRWIRRVLLGFDEADYGRLLDLLEGAPSRALSATTRDDAPKTLRQVCLAQPRLLVLALRSLTGESPLPLRRP